MFLLGFYVSVIKQAANSSLSAGPSPEHQNVLKFKQLSWSKGLLQAW